MSACRWSVVVGLAISIGIGCGGSSTIEQPVGGAGGSAGSGGQGAAGGQGGEAGHAGHGGGAVCGGRGGMPCDAEQYCDFQPSTCGADDRPGICTPRPSDCPAYYEPICGCDGNVHGNACDANSAGVDINWLGGCTPPGGMFSCGVGFCQLSTQHCRIAVSDIGGWDNEYSCHPYPAGCGNTPTCGCVVNEPCGDWCEVDAGGNITLTCPGG